MERINIIAAIGKNRELGSNNEMLWYLPEDFKHFKNTTFGHPVIMGRSTYESIGKALPGRLNIILTNQKNYKADGCIIAYSMEEAVNVAKKQKSDEIFIIGGGNVYKQAIDDNIVNRLYLTLVDAEFPQADVFFPEYKKYGFTKVVEERESKDETFVYKFVTLERND